MDKLHRPIRRIHPSARRLRPPNAYSQPHNCRYFAQNVPYQHVVSPGVPRPQLPFLHAPTRRAVYPQRNVGGQLLMARHLSTEKKIWLKEQVKLGVKYGLYGWAILLCISIAAFGIEHEQLERRFPSPHDWNWITRLHFRNAHKMEDEKINQDQIIDWPMAGAAYAKVLERLEDPKGDGQGLLQQAEGGIFVEGVGQAGFDITGKSEPWRRGYFETLMGCGRAAQHMDGWVKDTSRQMTFAPEYMIGPSNPNPRPTPPYMHSAPLEENCIKAYPSPETFYMKILTTNGFTKGQRIQAALAYADWLDFKGLRESGEEMYRWALDIAVTDIPNVDSIIDMKSGVIRESAPSVTSNILQAATSLATHFAQQNDLGSALPIYLSVLRARRSAPVNPEVFAGERSEEPSWVSTIISLLKAPEYPPPPPTGDEVVMRDDGSQCDDAMVMAYIGEVLFVSSPSQRNAGLRWTRDAVEVAETTWENEEHREDVRKKCSECAEMGLRNWLSMLRQLAKEEEQKEGRPQKAGWKSWLRLGGEEAVQRPNWEEEELAVESRLMVYRERALKDQYGPKGMLLPGLAK